MKCSILFIELSLSATVTEYDEILNRAYNKAMRKGKPMYETDDGHVDESLLEKGIGVSYHGDKKRKRIRLTVYPGLVLGDDPVGLWKPTTDNISRLCDTLDKLINKYFSRDYDLTNFTVSRVDFAADLGVGSRERTDDYLRILRNVGKVKCFSPIKYDKNGGIIDKEKCFALKGNSRNVEFWAYGLKADKRIMRIEVRLTKNDTVSAYFKEANTPKLIGMLAKNCEPIFMDTFEYIIPPGEHFTKPKTEKLIRERVPEPELRRRLIRLISLIKEQKSLHLGQKALGSRYAYDVMAKFAEISLSPVTISKRHGIKKLDSFYDYLG